MNLSEYHALTKASPKPNKYRNKPVVIDGERFDSHAEGARWSMLRLLERAGEISELKRQVRYPLVSGDALIATYVADFVYRNRAGVIVVEDVKSKPTVTRDFKLKARLFKALHGFDITITGVAARERAA